jgi:hypothetical protein
MNILAWIFEDLSLRRLRRKLENDIKMELKGIGCVDVELTELVHVGPNDRLVWARELTSGFRKRCGISQPAEQQTDSQKRHYFMELVL